MNLYKLGLFRSRKLEVRGANRSNLSFASCETLDKWKKKSSYFRFFIFSSSNYERCVCFLTFLKLEIKYYKVLGPEPVIQQVPALIYTTYNNHLCGRLNLTFPMRAMSTVLQGIERGCLFPLFLLG